MKIEITADILLDDDARRDIDADTTRVLGRLRHRIRDLDLRIETMASGGKSLCQVTVRLANHVLIVGRDRHHNVRCAAYNALRRTKRQLERTLRRHRAASSVAPRLRAAGRGRSTLSGAIA